MGAGFVEGLSKVTGVILDQQYNLRMMRKAQTNFANLTSIHPSMEPNIRLGEGLSTSRKSKYL